MFLRLLSNSLYLFTYYQSKKFIFPNYNGTWTFSKKFELDKYTPIFHKQKAQLFLFSNFRKYRGKAFYGIDKAAPEHMVGKHKGNHSFCNWNHTWGDGGVMPSFDCDFSVF